ncbi:hypothetical protein CR203_04955 [Salipaludibacillus neizhouensis]|uniref:Uncharacterized protein n=1 Tax=Salipaludibacillus neizhouensis TaxID=885475 RepID=A0A3A9K5K8_9BACI|nr:hypothetical protein [Salipaludibacillus neizhouensis]RKL67857.1 hypothetical protein CR203_04955 [Salipaludibacillus neizhouensis]
MGKKICWAIIFLTVALNVVMLQWAIESYLGHEFEKLYQFSIVALLSSFIALIAFLKWRRLEYSQ